MIDQARRSHSLHPTCAAQLSKFYKFLLFSLSPHRFFIFSCHKKSFFLYAAAVFLTFALPAKSAVTEEYPLAERSSLSRQQVLQDQMLELRQALRALRENQQTLEQQIEDRATYTLHLGYLQASYQPTTTYKLDPDVTYVAPDDPLFRVKSPTLPFSATEFIKHSCFQFFHPTLEKNLVPFIRLLVKKDVLASKMSFEGMHGHLVHLFTQIFSPPPSADLWKGFPLSLRITQTTKTMVEQQLKDARHALDTRLSESRALFEQYKEPEGSTPKKKNTMREVAAKKLGLTRATLHRLVEQKVGWEEWLKTRLLLPFIQAGMEANLAAIVEEEYKTISQQPRILPDLTALSDLKKKEEEMQATLEALKKEFFRNAKK